ncbi:hypothetical protein [Bradyrhizobium sp. SZCCHNS3053]|uniref:hypothetical protein n=1 Tax=Bradyrhizobium sp. SZCCHNS3053 TaxID=3057322 RepID=UPI002916AB8A|nr:hypothetical protein [Bradyrhizobium sp. SZCCHNS3053]
MKSLLHLVLAGLLTAGLLPARAETYTIHDDGGGVIVKYVRRYSDMRDNHQKIEVAGECASACTLFLGLLPETQYCVRPTARLGFHTATAITRARNGKETFEYAPELSYLMFSLYPYKVRKLVKSLGWDGDDNKPHPDLVWVEGDNLEKIAPICGGEKT